MSRSPIPPTCTVEDRHGHKAERYEHPAYGTITLTNPVGHKEVLFGSDIGHGSCLCIEVRHAVLHRDLSHDWIHGSLGKLICQFELSHAQFAEFITGVGKGEGTPVTLRCAPETPAVEIPGIERIETKQAMFQREIRESAHKQMDKVKEQLDRLGEMIDSGKIGKKELRELHHTMKCQVENTSSSMAFVVKQAEEALEKATTAAKIEVESFIGMKAKQLGLESIEQLARLENKGAKA